MIIVSACLAGCNCRYDGKNSCNDAIAGLVANGDAIPVCPEQLGGCATPRPPAEITGGEGKDVLSGKAYVFRENREDATPEFIRGADEVLKLAKLTGARKAVLKSKSPSCGCGEIYDGSFSGRLVQGDGVTAHLLKLNGIEVYTEKNYKP